MHAVAWQGCKYYWYAPTGLGVYSIRICLETQEYHASCKENQTLVNRFNYYT